MTRYRITIDSENCALDRLCCEEAPNTFDVDEQGRTYVVDPEGDPPEYIKLAAKRCQMQAITLHDAETGEQVYPKRR